MQNEGNVKTDFKEVHITLMKRVFSLLITLLLIFYGCSHKAVRIERKVIPDKTIVFTSISRIDSLLGFYFDWQFERKEIGLLPEIRATLHGKVSLPDRFCLKGKWKTGAETENIDVYSIKGDEYIYNKTTKTYEKRSGGSFPNPLKQLKLILSFREFKFIKFECLNGTESYLFSFKPNIYFLDPAGLTKTEGVLWLDENNGLPIRVKVSSENRIINWDMKLSRFNSFTNISVPFRTRKIRIIGIDSKKQDIAVITERIHFLGYEKPEVKIEKDGDAIFFIKAEELSDSLLDKILERGRLELFIGAWPEEPIFELQQNSELLHEKYGKDAKLFFERGIITKPIISIKVVLTKDAFSSFEVKNDFLGKYSIYAKIKQECINSLKNIIKNHKDEPLAVVVDNRAVSVSIVQDSWLVDNRIPIVKGMKSKEAFLIFSKLREGVLEKDYKFRKLD